MIRFYFHKLCDLSVPLILGILIALTWANIDFESYYNLKYTKVFGLINLHFFVNDIFMVFFFGLACVEIVREFSPEGHLYPIKKAVANLLGAAGGMLFPVGIFFSLNYFIGKSEYTSGWAIPTATDVAIALLFANIIFGKKHPAVSFLLLLAILDDAMGLGIIALFYPNPLHPVNVSWLSLVLVAITLAWLINKFNIRNYWIYVLFPGVISWVGMIMGNLHPALALIFIVPFIPNKKKFVDKKTCLDKFERDFKVIVECGLFFFGLVNAGVVFASVSWLTLIISASLIFGKTVGIFSMAKLATFVGFKLPKNIGNIELLIISIIASVGLTVSLFISDIAYSDPSIQGAAKMGALISILNGFVAIVIAKLFLKHKK